MTFAILRRHFLLGSLSLLLGSLFMPAFAADLLDEIKSNGTLEVGLEGTYPPFNYQDESGELTGFEVDFANALTEELGVRAEFQPTKWDGILAALESKRLDVVINQVTISEERKQKYDFSTPTPSPAFRPSPARPMRTASSVRPTSPARRSGLALAPTTSSG